MNDQPTSSKFSRRQFGQLAAGSSLAVAAAVIAPQAHNEQEQKAANEWRRRAFEAIAKFDVPMATEPGFVFRP
jgi:hypothetical protein